MKVCFISMYAYPLFNETNKSGFGGAEVQLYNLATLLAKNSRFEVSFVVRDLGQKQIEKWKGVKLIKVCKSKLEQIPVVRAGEYFVNLWKVLSTADADVYVQRAAGVETGIIAGFCKLNHKKFIYMAASSIDVNGEFAKDHSIWGKIYLWGLKNANVRTVQNREFQQQLHKRYNLPSVVFRNTFRIAYRIPKLERKNTILWVGSSQDLKRPELFLKLARDNSNVKFEMIMPQNNEKVYRETNAQAKHIKNLTLISQVPYSKVENYYKRALIFVNTSTFEGFPNTFVQAAAAGVPILSLKVNPDNFLENFSCGIACGDNYEILNDRLKYLLANNNVRQKMAKNGFRYVKSNHDSKEQMKKFKLLLMNHI